MWLASYFVCFSNTGDARNDGLNDGLQSINLGLDRLNNMGKDMNIEIQRQNQQIDRVNEKVYYHDKSHVIRALVPAYKTKYQWVNWCQS